MPGRRRGHTLAKARERMERQISGMPPAYLASHASPAPVMDDKSARCIPNSFAPSPRNATCQMPAGYVIPLQCTCSCGLPSWKCRGRHAGKWASAATRSYGFLAVLKDDPRLLSPAATQQEIAARFVLDSRCGKQLSSHSQS